VRGQDCMHTVFTGDLLRVESEGARYKIATYIVRGTYIADTGVIGAFNVP
jgi:hypothetical protein